MSFGPLKRLPSEAARQHRARAVLLQPHDRAVVVGAPDEPALRVQARAAGPDQQHVRAAAARLRAGVVRRRAGVAGVLQEHGDLLVRRDLVDDVVEQPADEQVAASCPRAPTPALRSGRSRRAISSAFAFGATSASSAGSARVMLNGFAAGGGPSPRMVGAVAPARRRRRCKQRASARSGERRLQAHGFFSAARRPPFRQRCSANQSPATRAGAT